MLKLRILTALVLIPLMLGMVLFLTPPWFLLATALIALVGAWEWAGLMQINRFLGKLTYVLFVAMAFTGVLFIPVTVVFAVSFCWWLIALLMIYYYPRGSAGWGRSMIIRGVMGVLTLAPCWVAINFLRNETTGLYSLLFLLVLIWGADTSAYFVGKKWGKDKLAPLVSPGKSKQGVVGALVFSALVALAVLKYYEIPTSIWPWAMALSLVTVIFSIVGDLFESMMKRQVGLKDSGKILPGHGGLLDRIDSLTAAAPVFVLGAILIGSYFA